MFCSFCTIPADNKSKAKKSGKVGMSSLFKRLITGTLVFVWIILIAFGVVASTDPGWLTKFAGYGRTSESRYLKDIGDSYLRQKNYYMAIPQYLQALKIKPDFVGARVNAAIAYNLAGNSAKGIELLEEALLHDTDQKGTIYYNLADILAARGEDSIAIEYYLKAENTEIEPHMVLIKLGLLYMKNKEFEKACAAFENALEIQNNPATPYLSMLREAVVLFESSEKDLKVIKQNLQSEHPLDQLAAYDLEVITEESRTNPEIAKTHNHLAAIYAIQGDLDKAIEHFEKSLKIWPGNMDARRNLPLLRQAKNEQQLAQAGS